jgi:hypothetical protein
MHAGGRSGALEPSTVATCAKHAREIFFSSSQQIPSNKTTTKLDLLLQHRTQTSILLLERSDLSKEIRIKCHEILQNSSLLISPRTTTTQARKQGCKQTSRAANFLPSFLPSSKPKPRIEYLTSERKRHKKKNKTKEKKSGFTRTSTKPPLCKQEKEDDSTNRLLQREAIMALQKTSPETIDVQTPSVFFFLCFFVFFSTTVVAVAVFVFFFFFFFLFSSSSSSTKQKPNKQRKHKGRFQRFCFFNNKRFILAKHKTLTKQTNKQTNKAKAKQSNTHTHTHTHKKEELLGTEHRPEHRTRTRA